MTLITLPTGIEWRKREWSPNPIVEVNRSPWNHSRKVLDFDGGYYSVDAAIMPVTTEAERREVRAFYAALRGAANTFELGVSDCDEATGDLVTTANAAAGAMSLAVSGPAGMVLRRGQYVTVLYSSTVKQFVMLTATLTLSGGGAGTIAIDQALRAALTSGAAVKAMRPTGIVSLDDAAGKPEVNDGVMTWAFTASEAF